MSLVGEWRKRMVGAASVGVAAPLAVTAAAVAVGFGGGGVAGLGEVGQAVTGPVIPDQRRVSADTGRPEADLLARTKQVRRRATARSATTLNRRTTTAASGTRDVASVNSPSATGAATPKRTAQPRTSTTARTGSASGARTGTTGTQTTQVNTTPAAPAAKTPDGLVQTGNALGNTVGQLPLVGEAGKQVVTGLVDAADGLLNPNR